MRRREISRPANSYKTIGEQRRPQGYELGATRGQTTGTSVEDVGTADQRGDGGCRDDYIDMALDRLEWMRRTRPTSCR